jgi:E3 ubiquitin-protein ligase SHPRH
MRQIALEAVAFDCGTTLIVVPSNILVQWVDELQRHIEPGSISVKVYSGQVQAGMASAAAAQQCGSRSRSATPAASSVRSAAAAAAAAGRAAAGNEVVTAAQLAAADIVLTSYEVMRREVLLQPSTDAASAPSLRHRKRYAVVPTPLSRLVFWRLVLDEAQLAGGTTKAAEMAQHIKARHRWAITGTPISHGGAADIFSLLRYLQVPYHGMIPRDLNTDTSELPCVKLQRQLRGCILACRVLHLPGWHASTEGADATR